MSDLDKLIADLNRLASLIGMKFVVDPEKIARIK